MPLAAAGAEAAPARRVIAVDLLRLLALLQMVNGHTVDAIMEPSLRSGVAYDRYLFVRGLVSVAFLVAAGLAFHLATLLKFDEHRRDPAAIFRRVRRALMVVGIGYFLQAPAVIDLRLVTDANVRTLLECEVLQCIGLSLLVLEAITLLARRSWHVVLAAGIGAALLFALAPLGDAASDADGPAALVAFLGRGAGGRFPLVPWSGFVLIGVVLGAIAYPQGGRTRPLRAAGALLTVAVVLLIAAWLAKMSPWSLAADATRGSARLWFILQNLGVVVAILAALAVVFARLARLPRLLHVLSAETLALYVFHLLVLFATPLGPPALFGRTLPLPSAALVSAAMILLTAAFGLAWHRAKSYWHSPFAPR